MDKEERKVIDKVMELLDKKLKEVDRETGENRANAYTVRLEDNYAITLRDNFNKLRGEWEALATLKNEIINLLEDK